MDHSSKAPYYGFNFQWMFSSFGPNGAGGPPPADERALDFLAEHGFNFIRIPTDYRLWTKDFDYFHLDESVFENLDRYLEAAKARGIHMSLNVHRAPGYCINRTDLERHNL
jgi:aryl-phospho-beta-D-glucosidase BglC (GH1 family)